LHLSARGFHFAWSVALEYRVGVAQPDRFDVAIDDGRLKHGINVGGERPFECVYAASGHVPLPLAADWR